MLKPTKKSQFNQSLNNRTLINQRDNQGNIRAQGYATKGTRMGHFAKTAAESRHHSRQSELPADTSNSKQ
jgi:hypothetical protein